MDGVYAPDGGQFVLWTRDDHCDTRHLHLLVTAVKRDVAAVGIRLI